MTGDGRNICVLVEKKKHGERQKLDARLDQNQKCAILWPILLLSTDVDLNVYSVSMFILKYF